jgi:hypothetical protein
VDIVHTRQQNIGLVRSARFSHRATTYWSERGYMTRTKVSSNKFGYSRAHRSRGSVMTRGGPRSLCRVARRDEKVGTGVLRQLAEDRDRRSAPGNARRAQREATSQAAD